MRLFFRSNWISRYLSALYVALALWPTGSFAQEEDDEELRQGLVATYASRETPRETVTRVDRQLAFDWGSQSPDPRLSQGPFSAKWRGFLLAPGPGEYRIAAYGAGDMTITLAGERILQATADSPQWSEAKPLEIPFGWHTLEIEYASRGESPRFALFWSGPQFSLEPISPRQLYHNPEDSPAHTFARGEALAAALRCGACHASESLGRTLPAPALDRLQGTLSHDWLVAYLSDPENAQETAITRRMPHFAFSPEQAQAVAAYLLTQGEAAKLAPTPAKSSSRKPAAKEKTKVEPPSAATGERLALTLGCLACHQVNDLGQNELFGGGDLSRIAQKRPAAFFERWLADPASLNRDHRMPVFDLTDDERKSLALYLAARGDKPAMARDAAPSANEALVQQGRDLVAANRCGVCHTLPENAPAPLAPAATLSAESNWRRACSTRAPSDKQPTYRLSPEDQAALQEYWTATERVARPTRATVDARLVLRERNCVACHERDESPGLSPQLTRVIAAHTDLAAQLPAMTPPPLASVGDKLHESALLDAIRRTSGVHRPWLAVRMPKFSLSDEEQQALVQHFVALDRIPARPDLAATEITATDPTPRVAAAGARLVTSDGFGCVSCHRVGTAEPEKAPLNTRGPDLTLLSRRIRHEWFERWVRNPARIVPRMEMPAVQMPVRGVLDDSLDDQLAAVWRVLNTPGFEPPPPNPVRVLRRSGLRERNEAAIVATDVLYDQGREYLKPLLIGLPNRHNFLFDLGANRPGGWWVGDAAYQRTKGKTWFWESGGGPHSHLLAAPPEGSELAIEQEGRLHEPLVIGQFPTEADSWRHEHGAVVWRQRLHFAGATKDAAPQVVHVEQSFTPVWSRADSPESGFVRHLTLRGIPTGVAAVVRVVSTRDTAWRRSDDGRGWETEDGSRIRIVSPVGAKAEHEGVVKLSAADDKTSLVVELEYRTTREVDTYPVDLPELPTPTPTPLRVAPGFDAVQLPLRDEIMPTALAWTPDGALVLASLKGRVWLARDTNGDGLEDSAAPLSDDLAAPYGLATRTVPGEPRPVIDVINKYGLLRLYDTDGDGRAERTETLASGWGHTTDYHDWAVGLPRDEEGNYYVALPCQQDDRSEAAAHLRGTLLRLVPREPTEDDPRSFSLEQVTAGHRFPMGIARRRDGEMFVTDNQGNYNPFNELNHIIPERRYGFINKLEQKQGLTAPLTPPAIDLPHPWTRSVNGICFLETPPALREKLGRDAFGPFEGHLVGCEMNNRMLVRMSLQRVGDVMQGAAYPLTYSAPAEGPALLGPLCAEVSPEGDLYVGSLLDSGWGGGNNIGSLVRFRPQLETLPAGIRELRAEPEGLRVEWTRPISQDRATDVKNYAVSSYTRVSTPAYGGEDVDRRTETIRSIEAAPDGGSVLLRLSEWREGYVYELHVKNLTDGDQEFFPAEAHYTLRRAP